MMCGAGRFAAILKGFVLQPEDVEVDLVAFEQVFVCETLEPFALLAIVAVLRIVALDEVVEVCALEGVLFEGEMFVRPQVVDPQLLGPRFLLRGFALKH